MRLLILGGTQFLGRAIAAHAHALGHDVTCAARGLAGPVPTGVRLVHIDRDDPQGFQALTSLSFDAVVDVARHPGHVRSALAQLRTVAGHWTFVSTVSVYSDNRTVGQSAETAPLLAPTAFDVNTSTDETYGAAKVACEQLVGSDAFICRPGLIVGPGDPTRRFTYWPDRLHRGGEVLVAGAPEDFVQFIDVPDLAAWIVLAVQSNLKGVFDAVGSPLAQGQFFAQCAQAVGASVTYTWVDRAFMEKQGLKHWAGPGSLPMWLPLPDFAGFARRENSAAIQAGLKLRPLLETAGDTLLWSRETGAFITGMTQEQEQHSLKVWHESRA